VCHRQLHVNRKGFHIEALVLHSTLNFAQIGESQQERSAHYSRKCGASIYSEIIEHVTARSDKRPLNVKRLSFEQDDMNVKWGRVKIGSKLEANDYKMKQLGNYFYIWSAMQSWMAFCTPLFTSGKVIDRLFIPPVKEEAEEESCWVTKKNLSRPPSCK